MEINKVESEPIASCSTNQIKHDRSSAMFKLVVASLSNNVSTDLRQCQMEIKSTVGFCHNNKSEQVTCSEQEQDAKLPSKIHDPSNTKPSTNILWQCQSFVNNVLINLCQYQMEINNVKSQSINSWQCWINKVDLKLLSSCSIDHSRQCRSNFDMTLSINKKSSVTFKLVVVSITFECAKGSFKVSVGAF